MTEWIASTLAGTPAADLVGVADIAEILGCSRQRVNVLKKAEDFPPKLASPSGTDIYVRADILAYAKIDRQTGRPRKADEHEPWMRPGLLAVNTMALAMRRLGYKTSHDRARPGLRVSQSGPTRISVSVDTDDIEEVNTKKAARIAKVLKEAGYTVEASPSGSILYISKVADAWVPPRFYKKSDGNYVAHCADYIGRKETYSISRRQSGSSEQYWGLTVSQGIGVTDDEYAVKHPTKQAAQARALEIWKTRRQAEWDADRELAATEEK
jgi:hypothetical protein